jgi:hypothetical protein
MISTTKKNGALIYREDDYNLRWLDGLGENVVKYLMNIGMSFDDQTNDPTAWTNTEIGSNTIVSHTTEGGGFLITTGGTEYNGINLQLQGSAFKLEADKPLYFGIKCKSENATKGDFLVGLCEIDTTLLLTSGSHAVNVTDDGVYFYHLNDETDITFANELSGTAGTTAGGITYDTDYHVYEFYWDGTALHSYLDDVLLTTITTGQAAVALTPSINVRAGDDGAEVFDVQWLRVIQAR